MHGSIYIITYSLDCVIVKLLRNEMLWLIKENG